MSNALPLGPFEITEENLADAQPRVRAELVRRYEELYDRVQVRVTEDQHQADGGRPLDPRYLELGIRILKELSGLYRLGRQVILTEDDDQDEHEGVDRRQLVAAQLSELEAKRRAKDSGKDSGAAA